MRFLVHPAATHRARLPVRVFLAFAALALAGFAARRVLSGGLSAAGVEDFYLGGSAGERLAPAALWEEVHTGAFLYGFVLFMLGSLLPTCPVPRHVRAALVGVAFVTTVLDLFAPFAVAAGAGGALRVGTFVAAEASLAVLLSVVAVGFGRTGGGARG